LVKFVAGLSRRSRRFRFLSTPLRQPLWPLVAIRLSAMSVSAVTAGAICNASLGISAALEISRLVVIPLVAPRIPGVQVAALIE